MAIKLLAPAGQGGNNNICLGGIVNDPVCTPWGNPLAGATELTIAITLNPDSLPAGPDGSQIFQNDGSNGFQSTFQLRQFGGPLYFNVYDALDGFDMWHASSVALTVGAYNRILVRWRGSDKTVKIQLNEQDLTLTSDSLPHTIAQVSTGAGNAGGPIEIGALSMLDKLCTVGTYAEAALWTHFKSDADALKYGQGWAPPLLDATGRVSYMTLQNITAGVVDQWRTFTGTFFEPQNVQNATHPAVFTTPPNEDEPPYIPHLLEDEPSLPVEWIELYERQGFAGKRSANPPIVVNPGGSIQAAMNSAVPGDDIDLTPGGTYTLGAALTLPAKTVGPGTPRMPPRLSKRRVRYTGGLTLSTRPRTSAGSLQYDGCRPSSIRIRTTGTLPTIGVRDIRHPDGLVSRVCHESARVGPLDRAQMATISTPNSRSVEHGFDTHGNIGRGWVFHGLWFDYGNVALVGDGDSGGNGGVPQTFGPNPTRPKHITFNQCVFDGDPLRTAAVNSVGKLAFHSGEYIGWVNCYIDNYYAASGGESILFDNPGEAPGPAHYENNTLRNAGTFGMWAGGGGSRRIGVLASNFIFRRNYFYAPAAWRKSEQNCFQGQGGTDGWQVTIAADGITVTRAGGGGSWGLRDIDAPGRGSIMYEDDATKTGIARVVLRNNTGEGGEPPNRLTLDTPWPGAPITTPIKVYFQWAYPINRYNSGTVVGTMPTATFTNGSATVTFTAALPATVEARIGTGPMAIDGHYIYPNTTHWGGSRTPFENADNIAFDNSWGTARDTNTGETFPALFRPKSQARRQEIIAIAGDRLSCTLAFPWPDTTVTFPYSVVTHDGLARLAPSKGSAEMKVGKRILIEGNVFEYSSGGGAFHGTSQMNHGNNMLNQDVGFVGTISITGDLATITSGTPGFGGDWNFFDLPTAVDRRRNFGHPFPYWVIVCTTSGRWDNDFFSTREIAQVLSATEARLVPVDPRMDINQQPTSYSGKYGVALPPTPWYTIQDVVYRYNTHISSLNSGHSWFTGGENPGEITKGFHCITHDNLFIRMGEVSLYFNGPRHIGSQFWTGESLPRPGYGTTTGDCGSFSWRHNTHVRNMLGGRTAIWAPATSRGTPGWVQTNADTIELTDNLMTDLTSSTLVILGTENADPIDSLSIWNEPHIVEGNLFVGSGAHAAVAVSSFAARHPQNKAFTFPTEVGLRDHDNVDYMLLNNYIVDDIYNTGTVLIDAGGTVVTLEGGGSFPATVVPGQFFKTSTSTEVVKIATIENSSGLSGNWAVIPGWAPLVLVGNRVRASAGSQAANGMTHVATLPNDQWVQVSVPTATSPLGLGVILRSGGGQTGFLLYFNAAGTYIFELGGPQLTFQAVVLSAGSDILFEAVGTALTGSTRPTGSGSFTPIVTAPASSNPSGRSGMFISPVNVTDVEFSAFSAGNYVSGSRNTLVSDPFVGSSAFQRITLVSPYPETGAGKSFAIGFKGTGVDGKTPGANLTLLAEFTAGVTSVP